MTETTETKEPETMADWREKVPPEVQKCADKYAEAQNAKSTATEKFNTAKENCLDAMEEHDCRRVPINNGEEFLTMTTERKLKRDKPKEIPAGERELGEE